MGSLPTRSLLDASVLVEPYGLSGLYTQSNNGIMNQNHIITELSRVLKK